MHSVNRHAEAAAAGSRPLVHVVDDDGPVRESTALLLRLSGHEVRTYSSGREFLDAVGLDRPGCVLLDVRLPDIWGLDVQQQLNGRGSLLPIVMITGRGDVATAVRAIKAGAVDFIEKPLSRDLLNDIVERALSAASRQPPLLEAAAARARIARLTPRECQVLHPLVSGHSNKVIASDLGLSPRTVEMHRAHMMERMGAHTLPDALRVAYDAGLYPS